MLSHIDSKNRPAMVDVSAKPVTRRTARARSIVQLTPEIVALFKGGDIAGPKGPVFHTAIVAGTLAAKKTGEIIPFCHPLPIEDCKIDILLNQKNEAIVECAVATTSKTGVEMEALTAVSVAALTIYDMCKAVSKGIIIKETRLIDKTGGKSGDYHAK